MPNAEWTALIADDEPAARRGVRQLLSAYPEFAVVGECGDGAGTLAALDTLHPHVVFLDIQMPGMDGFEVIRRRTPERMPNVVFLTAYDQFAIQAFEAQALDYLLKPVTEARFAATMRRLAGQLRGRSSPEDSALLVATSRGALLIPVQDIDWIEACDNYSRVWSRGRSHLLREPLHALEARMRSHGFERAHRCALVRVASIRRLSTTAAGGLVAVLSSGARIAVSRRRRSAFNAAIRALTPNSPTRSSVIARSW